MREVIQRARAPDLSKTGNMSEDKVTITFLPDGPIEVKGEVELLNPDGTSAAEISVAYLCRCGQSKDKPFCDGSHKKAGFSDPGQVPSKD